MTEIPIWMRKKNMKTKQLTLILTLFLALSMAMTPAVLVSAQDPAIEITKTPYCTAEDGFSDNPIDGFYPMGTKIYMWIRIQVTAGDEALTDVVVYDRLGAEWMVEGICEDVAGYANASSPTGWTRKDPRYPNPDERGRMDYTLVYSVNPEAVPIIGSTVTVLDNTDAVVVGLVPVEKNGKLEFSDYTILWTGKSTKVHFMWNIGSMAAGEERVLFLVISTDLNPAGKQEYTSCGDYELNSGAVVKALNGDGKKVTAETDSIMLSVQDLD
jgi:hypothetical protein